MPEIVAGRFVAAGSNWIDLASGTPVRLHVERGGSPVAERAWADDAAALANLRHPLINPLLDFGALDATRRFEAYCSSDPVPAPGPAGPRLLAHAVRFLQAHAIPLAGQSSNLAIRSVASGAPFRGRAIGIVLQNRAALDVVTDSLDCAAPRGVSAIVVCGEEGSGLGTLQVLVARAARIRGYVPVSARLIGGALTWLPDALLQRHVCVLSGDDSEGRDRRAVARFLARLGGASARHHVVVSFVRAPRGARHGIHIEPMGVRAMMSMVYVDAQDGPAPQELLDAARDADGRPGAFLARLRAARVDAAPARVFVVHESPEPYVIDPEPAVPPLARRPSPVRQGGVLRRAALRGDDLARRGRHAAASRLLSRAVRVLEGRGDRAEAATCAFRLGMLDLDRGRIASAAAIFERCRELTPDAALALSASIGVGTAWLEDGRLLEAEALLRATVVSAAAIDASEADADARRGLARALYWQGRYDEAAAVLRPIVEAPDGAHACALALAARVRLAQGALPQATLLARRALERAAHNPTPRGRIAAHRVMAAALGGCGDMAGARDHIGRALAAAGDRHLPLAAMRVRATWLEILAAAAPASPATCRCAGRMRAIASQPLIPRLLRFQIGVAVERALGSGPGGLTLELERAGGARRPPPSQRAESLAMAELATLMEMCHAAPDEGSALERLCETLLDKLGAATVVVVASADRRILARAGRAWHGEPAAAIRALAGTAGALAEPAHEPRQAAEPVRYGGDVIAALAVRWIAGTDVDPMRVLSLLKAGAIAAASSVRAVLDRVVPDPPDARWSDLLGSSPAAVALRAAVAQAARAPFPVLVEGESGSGKELVARAIHRLGPRRDRRFCAVNCAALSDDLLEAELFGHTRGAFTGAVGDRTGLFEDADGGTLFLDEVAELSPRAQAKLLRVLQDGEVRRVGENFPRRVDVRIVAATNRPLAQEVSAGRFRADLRFRLDVIRIDVPPLRDRATDIPLLATHFWNEASARVGSRATLSADALAALSRLDWPGNVRELQNAIAWMAVHSPRHGRVGAAGLPARLACAAATAAETLEDARLAFERRFVTAALARANGQRSRAAAAMGISRQGLAKMLQRLGLDG